MAVPGEVHVLSTVTAVEETMDVTLKDKQREAVASVGFMKGSDVFVSFPTRYGKSMVFAIHGLRKAVSCALSEQH